MSFFLGLHLIDFLVIIGLSGVGNGIMLFLGVFLLPGKKLLKI